MQVMSIYKTCSKYLVHILLSVIFLFSYFKGGGGVLIDDFLFVSLLLIVPFQFYFTVSLVFCSLVRLFLWVLVPV